MKLKRREKGFTLVEILIVVIILAILAGVVIPQFSSSTDEAKLAVLQSDLKLMRGAVELYYHQHNSVYPGDVTSNYSGHTERAEWFEDQLTLYTDVNGEAVAVRDATHKYGPYLKRAIPTNPFNDLNTMEINPGLANIILASDDGSSGWKFYTKTGKLLANDGAHGNY